MLETVYGRKEVIIIANKAKTFNFLKCLYFLHDNDRLLLIPTLYVVYFYVYCI